MTNNDVLYTQDEFRQNFNEFLSFLKDPAVATDSLQGIVEKGKNLSADKIYNMAERYNFLRFLIDRRISLIGDTVLIGTFLVFESNLIVQNWTGISMLEKGKIWLKLKVKQRKEQNQGKPKGWGFLGLRGVEKPTKQDSSPLS